MLHTALASEPTSLQAFNDALRAFATPGHFFNPATRTFSGNPQAFDPSPIQVRVTANDGNGGSGSDDFQLTLINVTTPRPA